MADTQPPGQKPTSPPAGGMGKDFRHIVRICNTDLDGNKSLMQGLRRIKGVNFMFANMACRLSNVNWLAKAGLVPEEHIKKVDLFLRNPSQHGAPEWMFNRRKDPETGSNRHIITNDLILTKDNDIKLMKKIRSYRGVRHAFGLPVRGQRTRSNFRRTKSKGGGGRLGVIRKKTAPQAPGKPDTKK